MVSPSQDEASDKAIGKRDSKTLFHALNPLSLGPKTVAMTNKKMLRIKGEFLWE